MSRSDTARPFVKWAGGKRALAPTLFAHMSQTFGSYFEPFVGGGALFWHLCACTRVRLHDIYLSDINWPLLCAYAAVRDRVEELIVRVGQHIACHTPTYYRLARRKFAVCEHPLEVAALFLYLNRSCYNGLYRVNKAGQFNVPLGRAAPASPFLNTTAPTPRSTQPAAQVGHLAIRIDEENLRSCARALANTTLNCQHFSCIQPARGDFVYLDPPYLGTFSAYDKTGFDRAAHESLAAFCMHLDARGVLFMLSNSDCPEVRAWYRPFRVQQLNAPRCIARSAHARGKRCEVLITNYPCADTATP
nr:DNA adenine methylase [Treponema pallidum]